MSVRASLCRVLIVVSSATLFACTGYQQMPDTPEQRTKTARTIARLAIEGGSLEQAIAQGAELGEASSAEMIKLELKRELTPEERERVRQIFHDVLAEILTAGQWEEILTDVFAAHFTVSELESILGFYRSPVGGKILLLEQTIDREIDARADQLFDGRLDEFIERVDEELASEFEGLGSGGSR